MALSTKGDKSPEKTKSDKVEASTKPADKTPAGPGSPPKGVKVNGKSVNFEYRAEGWPRGTCRAGVEGQRCAGYGDTFDDALEALKAAPGIGDPVPEPAKIA